MLLLDTHTLLWYLRDSECLPSETNDIISVSKDVKTSIACLWELAIKSSLGKLRIEKTIQEIEDICISKDIRILPISSADLDALNSLPDIHKDPFDRLLVCQAINHAATIITKDDNIRKYPVRTLW